MNFILSHEEFLAALEAAKKAVTSAPADRKLMEVRLGQIELEYTTDELPPMGERPWVMSPPIVDHWPREGELGFLLCEIEYFYCRRL